MRQAVLDKLEVLTGLAMAPAAGVPDALELMEEAIPYSMGSMLIWASASGDIAGGFSGLIGIEEGLAAYAEGFGNTPDEQALGDATFRQHMKRGTRSRRLDDVLQISREAFRETSVYQQMLAPWGIDDMARCVVTHGASSLGGLAVFRPPGVPGYTRNELETLDRCAEVMGRLLQCAPGPDIPLIDEAEPGIAELGADGCVKRATPLFHRHLAMQNQARPGEAPATFRRTLPPAVTRAARTLGPETRPVLVDSVWGPFRVTLARFHQAEGIGLSSQRRIPTGLRFFRRTRNRELSKRQRQVGCALVEGASFHDMAERWRISRNSVITHVNNLYDKLGVTGKTDLMNRYVWSGD